MKAVKLTKEWTITLVAGTVVNMEDGDAAAAVKAGTAILAGANEHPTQLPAPQLREDADRIAKEAREKAEKAAKEAKDAKDKEAAPKVETADEKPEKHGIFGSKK